jgi:hypothetical protein
MAERRQLNIDVDPEVVEILRKMAAGARLTA